MEAKPAALTTGRIAVLFCAVFALLQLLDRVTKTYFESSFALGTGFEGPCPWLVNFVLVHNTGGAWGMLSNQTFWLGVFALVISLALGVYAIFFNRGASAFETICLALVVAGGFGNAIDRFAFGYVVDFLNFGFIDFPVFNIADIGVTCGLVLFFLALLIRTAKEERALKAQAKVQEAQQESTDSAE